MLIKSVRRQIELDALVALLLLAGIAQALIGNLTPLNASYLTPALLASLCTLYTPAGLDRKVFFFSISAIALIAIFVPFGLLSSGTLSEERLFQLYFLLCLGVFSIISPSIRVKDNSFILTTRVLVVFLSLSLVVHFLYWEDIASRFYTRENNFGGLYMDGQYRRMYTLLLNPLAASFVSILIFCILLLCNCRSITPYVVLSMIILFTLSRTSMLSLVLLVVSGLLQNKKYPLLLGFVISIALTFVFIEDLRGAVYSLFSGSDKTGSASEHYRNLIIGVSMMGDPLGKGFYSATTYGGWNERLETTPFQFALTSGGIMGGALILVYIQSLLLVFLRRGLAAIGPIICVTLLFVYFPIHSFALPTTFFALYVVSWVYASKDGHA